MKLINWCKSHYFNILLFLIIFLIVSPVILCRPLNNLDEVWNYNFAQNIADGLVPYRDFNMLQTPLLPFVVAFFLRVFGGELIVSRILAIFLITFIFYMVYKILNRLKVNNFYNIVCVFLLFLLLKDHICIDYNFAILAITLILIYLSLKQSIASYKPQKNISTSIKNETPSTSFFISFLIGLLSGCCILLKQSTGMLIAFMSIFYPLLLVHHKIDFKNYVKTALLKIVGILLPISLLLMYLLATNALADFIDYTILGIKTFSNSISYMTLLQAKNIVLRAFSSFMPIFILFSGLYLLRKKKSHLFGFYCYAVASLIVIYPIADAIHFFIGMTPFIILSFYALFHCMLWLKEKLKWKKKLKLFFYEVTKCIIGLYTFYYFTTSILLLGNYLDNTQKKHTIKHFAQIPISEQLLTKITTIDSYILSQNTDVYLLDAEAAIYMLPINRYYKDFNLFLKGNLGSLGEDGQIAKINTLKSGSQILIKNNKYKRNWQTPEKVISYIQNNLIKIGEISVFDIYEVY